MIDFAKLSAPFSPVSVSWRIGSTNADKTRGMAFAYLDARDVMERLDAVCDPDGWQCKYSHVGGMTVCDIGIWCPAQMQWVWKADGAGQSDIEAEKGALSDAFKRAAVRWGIGRYLYALDSPWVEIETKGRTSVIKQHEYARLAALLHKQSRPNGSGIEGRMPPNETPMMPIERIDPADRHLVNGDGRSTYQIKTADKSSGRLAAELWASQAVTLFKQQGYTHADFTEWQNTPCTNKGTKTHGEKLAELGDKHPDLADAVYEVVNYLPAAAR